VGKQRKTKKKKYKIKRSLEIIQNLPAIGSAIDVNRKSYGLSWTSWDDFYCKCGNHIIFNTGFHSHFLVQCVNCGTYWRFDFNEHEDSKQSFKYKAIPVIPNLFDAEVSRYLIIIPSDQNPGINLYPTNIEMKFSAVLQAEYETLDEDDKNFLADLAIEEKMKNEINN